MPVRNQNRVFSVILFVGAILLLVFACTVQYSTNGSATNFVEVKENWVAALLSPASSKIPIPFGQKHGYRSHTSHVKNLQHNPNGLRKRASITWAQALSAGQSSLDLLNGPREQSQWTTLQQLEDNGWSLIHKNKQGQPISGGDSGSDTNSGDAGSDTSMHGSDDGDDVVLDPTDLWAESQGPYGPLNINQDGEDRWENYQNKRFDNCHHNDIDPSGGSFDNIYNPQSKTIVALYNYGPPYFLRNDPKPNPIPWEERLPNVWNWSNLVWVTWSLIAGNSIGDLKYLFRHEIATETTREVMNMVVPRAGSRSDANAGLQFRQPWPGHTFLPGSLEFQALLGIPHGKGVVRLLTQHPDELPGKEVESITIFTTTNHYSTEADDTSYDILFTLTGPGN